MSRLWRPLESARRERGSVPGDRADPWMRIGRVPLTITLLVMWPVGTGPDPAEPASDLVVSRPRLVDRTEESGLDHRRSPTWGSLWVDHDRDGWPEFFIGRHGAKPFFFRNSAG